MLSNIYAITVTVKYGYAGMDKYGWAATFLQEARKRGWQTYKYGIDK